MNLYEFFKLPAIVHSDFVAKNFNFSFSAVASGDSGGKFIPAVYPGSRFNGTFLTLQNKGDIEVDLSMNVDSKALLPAGDYVFAALILCDTAII